MCQAMPTGLYTRWELDSESGKFKPRQNKTRNFENMVVSYFQRGRPQLKWKVSTRRVHRKKLMHSVLMAFLDTVTLCLKLWDNIIIIAHVKKLVLLSLRKSFSEAEKEKARQTTKTIHMGKGL